MMMQVLDWELQRQLVPYMKEQVPLPGIYDPDFIAANQDTRADNIIKGTRSEQVEQVRQHIRTFKEEQKVDKVRSKAGLFDLYLCVCMYALSIPTTVIETLLWLACLHVEHLVLCSSAAQPCCLWQCDFTGAS